MSVRLGIMVNAVATKPTLSMKSIRAFLNEFELSTGTFRNIVTIEPYQISIFNASMRGVTGMARRPATFKISLSGNMTRVGSKALIGQNAGAFVATIAERIRKAVFNQIVTAGIIINKQPLIF